MRAWKHGLVASCPFIHKSSKIREGGSFSFVVSADRPLGRCGRSRSSRTDVLYTPVLPTLDPVISDSLVPFRWLSQDPPRTLKVQQLHIDRIVNGLLGGPSSPHLHHIVRHRECWGRHMHWGIDNDPPQVLLRPGQLGIYGAAAEAAPPGDPLPSIYVILGDSFRPFHECQANALITRHPEEA